MVKLKKIKTYKLIKERLNYIKMLQFFTLIYYNIKN